MQSNIAPFIAASVASKSKGLPEPTWADVRFVIFLMYGPIVALCILFFIVLAIVNLCLYGTIWVPPST